MTGQDFLDKLLPTIQRIEPNQKTYELFNEIKSTLNDFAIIDSFYQIKKNESGDGLALEAMFFNEQFIYDIVSTQTTIVFATVLTKNITKAIIESSFVQIENLQEQNSTVHNLKLTLFTDNDAILFYSTDLKRFSELNRIKNEILNLLIK